MASTSAPLLNVHYKLVHFSMIQPVPYIRYRLNPYAPYSSAEFPEPLRNLIGTSYLRETNGVLADKCITAAGKSFFFYNQCLSGEHVVALPAIRGFLYINILRSAFVASDVM